MTPTGAERTLASADTSRTRQSWRTLAVPVTIPS